MSECKDCDCVWIVSELRSSFQKKYICAYLGMGVQRERERERERGRKREKSGA